MHKVRFENKRGLDIVGYYYPSLKTSIAVILMHGWGMDKNGPSNYYPKLSEHLAKKFGVLRFDFASCGESEGIFKEFSISNYIQDGSAAIEFMKSLGYTEFYLVGHSLGGLVTLKLSLKYEEVYRVIAIAPPLFVKLPQQRLRKYFEKKNNLEIWDTAILVFKFLIDKLKIQPVAILNKISTYTTIIYSLEDSVCDYQIARPKIHDSFFIQWKEIKGADHNFSRKSDKKQLFKIILEELFGKK